MTVYLATSPRLSGTSGKRAIPHTDTRTAEPVEPVVAEITGRVVRSFLTEQDAAAGRGAKELKGGVIRLTGDWPDPSDPANDAFWQDRRTIDGHALPDDATPAEKAHAEALRAGKAKPREARGATITGTYTSAIVQPVVAYVLAHPEASPAEALNAVLSGPIDVDKPRKPRGDVGPRVDVMAQIANAITAAMAASKLVKGPSDSPENAPEGGAAK